MVGGNIMRISIKNVILILSLGFFITACANKLAITPTSPIIVYPGDMDGEKIDNLNWSSGSKIGEILIENLPRLNTASVRNYRPNRASAIGYPYIFHYSWLDFYHLLKILFLPFSHPIQILVILKRQSTLLR